MKKRLLVLSLLLIGFAAGIFFQRTFTVGKSARWFLSLFRDAPQSAVELSEPIEGLIDWSGYRVALERIELGRNGNAGKDELISMLKGREAEEIGFRASAAVNEAYKRLYEAKKNNEITAMEVRRNRFIRKLELEYQREDDTQNSHWKARTEAILAFNELLQNRGIHLIFMPVPNQADIELPTLIGAEEFVSSSPKHTKFLISLAENGVDVIDLRYLLGRRTLKGENMINRFDHHWSPQAVEIGADEAARRIGEIFDGLPERPVANFEYATVHLEEPVINFPHRTVSPIGSPLFARQVLVGGKTAGPFDGSQIAVFGDSMVMVYGSPYSSDVASHISARLGYPCQVIGKGSGSPLVPKMFLETYGKEKSRNDPKVVIWICVSRHQEYSKLEMTALPPSRELESGKYDVAVKRCSTIPNPATAPYSEALYTMEVTIRLPEGESIETRIYAPAFSKRKLLETAKIEVGKRYTMELLPWREAGREDPSLINRALIDDFDDLNVPKLFWKGE